MTFPSDYSRYLKHMRRYSLWPPGAILDYPNSGLVDDDYTCPRCKGEGLVPWEYSGNLRCFEIKPNTKIFDKSDNRSFLFQRLICVECWKEWTRTTALEQSEPGWPQLQCFTKHWAPPVRTKDEERYIADRAVTEYLADGGTIKQLRSKQRKYVFSPKLAQRVDALRKRAKRGDTEARKEMEWWQHRALPMPYVPEHDKRHDPDSIAREGDVFFDTYDHDHMELEEGNEGYKASASVHDLVRPNHTNSLDRLFGQEMYPEEASLAGAPSNLRRRWKARLKEDRATAKAEREAWHKLLKRPA